jgi:2-polyprenyl-3-methyl-5-hydroxy-6-metoxy-1,4-benzoquinol methylase
LKTLCSKIKKTAKSLVLIEIDSLAAKKLKEYNFDVIKGNAEKVKINKKFDVIILGDVIEHVDNVGLLIDNMIKHLKKDGEIIISSPNPFFIGHFFNVITFRKPKIQYDHTSFIAEDNLKEICRRHSLKLVDFRYISNIDNRNIFLFISSYVSKCIGKIWKFLNISWIATLKLNKK